MPLLFGEGVETTLTAIEATRYPGWATLGTSGFVNIELPDVVRGVSCSLKRRGGTSQKALDKVCPVLAERGIRVSLARAAAGLNDFDDLVKPEGSVRPSAGLVIAKMTIDAAQEWEPSARGRRSLRRPKHDQAQASFLVDLSSPAASSFAIDTESSHACFSQRTPPANIAKPTAPVNRFQPLVAARLLRGKIRRATSEAVSTTIKTLMAKARYDGLRREVFSARQRLRARSMSVGRRSMARDRGSTPTAIASSTTRRSVPT